MAGANTLASERAAVLTAIDPDAHGTGTHASGWVDLGLYGRIMAVLSVGAIAEDHTVTAKLRQAKTSAGGTPIDVAGKAITTLDDDTGETKVVLNLRADELNIEGGYRYAQLSVTIAGPSPDTPVQMSAKVLGLDARFTKASLIGADVAEIVE